MRQEPGAVRTGDGGPSGVAGGCRSRYVVASALLAMIVTAAAISGVPQTDNVTDVPGAQLRQRLDRFWPEDLSPGSVSHGYYASEATIDGHSTFLRFDADAAAAGRWRDFLEASGMETARWLDGFDDRFCETRKSQPASIPLGRVTGAIPEWWRPEGGPCDAWETMVWYQHSDSGVGRGHYYQYNPDAGCVWVYSYACQHDRLWKRGEGTAVSGQASAASHAP